MFKAYRKFWKQYADFKGRSSRSDYWWTYLANTLLTLPFTLFLSVKVMSIFLSLTPYMDDSGQLVGISEDQLLELFFAQLFSPATIIVWVGLVVLALATIVPSLAILVRRLRDAGFHWAFIFVSFIPTIGGIVLLILTLLPSKAGKSKDDGLVIDDKLFD